MIEFQFSYCQTVDDLEIEMCCLPLCARLTGGVSSSREVKRGVWGGVNNQETEFFTGMKSNNSLANFISPDLAYPETKVVQAKTSLLGDSSNNFLASSNFPQVAYASTMELKMTMFNKSPATNTFNQQQLNFTENPPSNCHCYCRRIIVITASNSINRKIVLDEEEYEMSVAQEAVVKIFERILDVAAETDGVSVAADGLVSCRLLAELSHAGSVIGKGVTATPEELGFEESIEFIKREGNEEEATKRTVERKRIDRDRVEDKKSVE